MIKRKRTITRKRKIQGNRKKMRKMKKRKRTKQTKMVFVSASSTT